MQIIDLEPVARHDRWVAAWQRVILVLVLCAALGLAVFGVMAAGGGGTSLDAMPPYNVTAFDQPQTA